MNSASRLSVAVIGAGRPRGTNGATGFGMAHKHVIGFARTGRCQLAAVADLSRENAEAFAAQHNPQAALFTDYREMLEKTRPDIVSVCLWPHLHAEVVCFAAALKPKVIFCEKPMDIHWDLCVRMHEACKANGVLLAINHQRRFNLPLVKAKALLDAGEIGRLTRIDGAWHNLMDTGTHVLDMMFFYNHETPAEWVFAQIEMRGAHKVFGAVHAGQGIVHFRFKNGVRAIYHFGPDHAELGCMLRLTGERGVIEILFDAPWLRVRRQSQAEWETIDTGENIHDDLAIYRAIADVMGSLETGRTAQLDSSNALRATEIIYAAHESAHRRGRVDLPLPPAPCALLTMLDRGELTAKFET